ncbi:MAG: succinylarginine dihydrolase [Gammaproteobacteria bacterium]|nr:succinylarginine dihydrolase [Gammaproteobacteria bacterium]
MTFSGEINFDGLIGPTHNYAGLSQGNLASQKHLNQSSNPQAAALQGLDKMRLIMDQGIPQGFFLPHERPHLKTLRFLGFGGKDEEVINRAAKQNPVLLKNVYSASSMWAANAATFSPSIDSNDQNMHITPANLNSMFHRSIEHEFTKSQLELMLGKVAIVHDPIKNISGYGDEGAANHLRVSEQHLKAGFQIFVYGSSAFEVHQGIIARQAEEISQAVSIQHQINPDRVLFLKQNEQAINAGSFHNDIVSLANEEIFIFHQEAFADRVELERILHHLKDHVKGFHPIEILSEDISLDDLVSSYLLNSQLITVKNNEMMMLLPEEVQNHSNCMRWLEEIKSFSPIKHIKFVDIRQSMMNGGGPACLRFKTIVNNDELNQINEKFLLTPKKLMDLRALVTKHYRDRLNPADLLDTDLIQESYRFLDELTQLLDLGNVYDFQRL